MPQSRSEGGGGGRPIVVGHRQRATGVAGNHGMNERVGGIGVGNGALLIDEVEDDAIVREPHRGVVEVG